MEQNSTREDLYNLPYGPLTRQAFDRLSNSFYDASQRQLHQIAHERGVESGEASRLSFAERLAERREQLAARAGHVLAVESVEN